MANHPTRDRSDVYMIDPAADPAVLDPGGDSSPTPLQVAMRHKWGILIFALIMAGAAFAMIRQLPPRYTATTEVMIDAQQVRVVTAENLLSNQILDVALLRTEMERLNAPLLARSVVEQLGLTTVPEYCQSTTQPDGWYRWISDLFTHSTSSASPHSSAPCKTSVEAATRQLLGAVTASNDGRSYIIKVAAEARSPRLAALIANTYANTFVTERRDERRAVAESARRWLSSYVTNLRQQVEAADEAVANYRATHRLTSVRGETTTAQTLAELNSQLTTVTGEIAQKQSMVDELETVRHAGGDASATAPVLGSLLIQGLLTREAELAAQEAKLRARLGDAHPQVIEIAAQMRRLRQQVDLEIGKTVTSISGELAALTTRRNELAAQVNRYQARVGAQGKADVQLQTLERDAVSNRQVYQGMLGRLREIEAQQGMENAGARVVVEALPPVAPSWPRTRMMTVGVFIIALGVGAGLAFARSLLLRVFRDTSHVEQETGLPVLGVFARPPRRTAPQDLVLNAAGSQETEALRSTLFNALSARVEKPERNGRILLITSALPGEGKSSFAVAFGRAAAESGLTTILLDCDMRRPSVRRLLSNSRNMPPSAGHPAAGANAGLTDVFATDRPTGMHVLPLSAALPDPKQLVASHAVHALLAQLRTKYDLVLLDTPPLLAVADALGLVPVADEVILIVDWRTTPRRAVEAAVRVLRRCGATLSGVVLSKVNLRRYSRSSSGYGYYTRRYLGYGTPPQAHRP